MEERPCLLARVIHFCGEGTGGARVGMLGVVHDWLTGREFHMSRNTKIVLAVFTGIVALVLLCAGLLVVSLGGLAWNGMARATEFDAAKVSREAGAIAEFALPEGYTPSYSFRAGGFKLVGYDPGDKHSHLMLVLAPEWVKLDAADFENYLRRNFGDMLGWGEKENNAIVDRRTLRVNGRAVEFAVGEGVSSDGSSYRSMAGVWDSPRGATLIYVEEPVTRWNQAVIDAFIASIR